MKIAHKVIFDIPADDHNDLALKSNRIPLVFVVTILAIILSLFSTMAQAQSASADEFALEIPSRNAQSFDAALAPFITLVPDVPGQISFQSIQRYRQQQAYLLSKNQKLINLGMNGKSFWLLFSVRNTSSIEDFVLDFGSLNEGRQGRLQELYVYNNTQQQQVVDYLIDDTDSGGTAQAPAYVNLELPPGRTQIFTVYLTTYKTMPSSIVPRLQAQDLALAKSRMSNLYEIIFYGLSFVAAALILLGRRVDKFSSKIFYLLFIAGFVSAYRLFSYQFVVQDLYYAYLPLVLIFVAMVAGLIGLAEQSSKNYLSTLRRVIPFLILAGGVIVAFFMGVLPGLLEKFAFHLAVFIIFLNVLYLIIRAKTGIVRSWHLISWGVFMAGYAVTVLGDSKILDPVHFPPQYFWLGYLIHALMISISAQYRPFGSGVFELEAYERQEIEEEEKSPEVQALEEVKEKSDYHKLLKVVERERKTMNELREKEAERVEQMRKAKVAADEANRAKSAFLAVVSHEIRTPMTGIMGMVRLLKDTKLDSSQEDYTETIQESSEAMLSLLNDILDFEKVETGQMELEDVDFDLRRLVQSVKALMQGHASDKNDKLNINIGENVPQYVKGDPKRLKQVLLNLVGNAVKFTEKGDVTINVQNLQEGEQSVTKAKYDIYFSVEDTGIGIPKEAQKNLFNPFAQADKSITRKYGGTGLGLAISQKLIEAMGGFISVNSAEGEGSTFFFSIMMEKGSAEEARNLDDEEDKKENLPDYKEIKKNQERYKQRRMPTQSEIAESDKGVFVGGSDNGAGSGTPRTSRGATSDDDGLIRCSGAPETAKNILVVDDNSINRKVMTGLVNRLNHNVKTVKDAQSGIQAAHERIWDLIFMDIELPDMMGTEAAKEILSSKRQYVRETPIVALTGNVRAEDLNHYKEVGMLDTLSKPVKPETLQQIIDGFPKRTSEQEEGRGGDKTPAAGDIAEPEEIVTDTEDEEFYEDKPVSAEIEKDKSRGKNGGAQGPGLHIKDKDQMDLESAVESINLRSSGFKTDMKESNKGDFPETPGQESLQTSGREVADIQEDKESGTQKDKNINEEITRLRQITIFDDNVLSSLASTLEDSKLVDLLDEFWTKTDETIEKLKRGGEQQDLETIRQKAHDLKGMAGNFGLMQMSGLADRIEYEAKYDDTDHAIRLLSLIPACYNNSKKALDKWEQSVKGDKDEGEQSGETPASKNELKETQSKKVPEDKKADLKKGEPSAKLKTTPEKQEETKNTAKRAEIKQEKEPEEEQEAQEVPEAEAEELEGEESASSGQIEELENKGIFDASILDVVRNSMKKSQLMGYLKGFCSKIENEISQLDEAIKDQDLEKIDKKAEQIGLMAENFGLKEIKELTDKTRKSVKHSDTVQLELMSEELSEAAQRARDALEKWVLIKDDKAGSS